MDCVFVFLLHFLMWRGDVHVPDVGPYSPQNEDKHLIPWDGNGMDYAFCRVC